MHTHTYVCIYIYIYTMTDSRWDAENMSHGIACKNMNTYLHGLQQSCTFVFTECIRMWIKYNKVVRLFTQKHTRTYTY